ncbi:zinc-binding protein [Falsiruegeria litorea R37]|uniref:Zinc-binding protein n=1 Tax=Falsiruegeria litorea R37 TaxID=1200284 RepID=A0A1Y5RVQ8_9RHOB|nr:DNA gyrase inhibitor YacG [Falsiruegeria litorea]SLN26351.1 zinc-binding protein [Falsiruegeria litorea R37]
MSCPVCEAETAQKYRPFCSKRCADLDLAKWLNGSYALPSQAPEDMDVDVSTEEKAPNRPH